MNTNKMIKAFAATFALSIAIAPLAMAENAAPTSKTQSKTIQTPNDAQTLPSSDLPAATGSTIESPAGTGIDAGGAGATGAQSEIGSSAPEKRKADKAMKRSKKSKAPAAERSATEPVSPSANDGAVAPSATGTGTGSQQGL